MRRFVISLTLTASLLGGGGAHAGIKDDLESPVTTDARWILLGGTGLTLGVLATYDGVWKPFEERTSSNKPLGKASKWGDAMGQLIPNALYAGGTYLTGTKLGKYRALMMVEASAYAAAITTVLKYTIREPRPYDSNVRNSFPSGHATTAFAFAGVVAAEHGWYYGTPAMLLATFVAYSRVNDNQHHVHDLVGGATIGLTCAYGIYYAHKDQREDSVTLLPVSIPGGMEVAATWKF